MNQFKSTKDADSQTTACVLRFGDKDGAELKGLVRDSLDQLVKVTVQDFANLVKVLKVHPDSELVVILVDRRRSDFRFPRKVTLSHSPFAEET